MKKFVFSLEKVLNLKKQVLEVKKNEMLKIENKIKEIEDEQVRLRQEFKINNIKSNEEMSKGTTPDKIMTYKLYSSSLIKKENKLKEDLLEQLILREKKKQELIDVKAEISGLEKLEEKQKTEYNSSIRKEQEKAIEEYVNQKSAALIGASDI